MSTKMRDGLITVAVGAILWFLPAPAGLKPIAWQMFALFVATIVGFILQPLPMGAMAIIGMTLTGLFKFGTTANILSGFSNSTVWLVVSAFMLSRGFAKTGLGRRVSYMLIERFGQNTLTLGYAIAASEAIFSPATPSSAARGGAIIFPIIRSLASAFGSEPGDTAKKIGAYLMHVGFHSNCMSGALFLTAMVGNPLTANFAKEILKVDITWAQWGIAAVVPGFLSMFLIPLGLYYMSKPEIRRTPEAKQIARMELEKQGPMTRSEKIMCGVFVGCIALWATSQYSKLDATLVALLGASCLLLTMVVTWQDILEEKGAWDTMIWIGVLVMMAGRLSQHGFIKWISENVAAKLVGFDWLTTLVIILLFYFYSHYMFASLTAHTTAMCPVLMAVALGAGCPPLLTALTMGFFGNFCACLTHYGNGVAPIYYGAGFVKQGTWWRINFQMSIVYIAVWLVIGLAWWKTIGLL